MLLANTIQQRYRLSEATIKPIFEEDWRQIYKLEQTGTSPWLLRAYAHPNSLARQERLVAVLELLEEHAHPAPRLIRAGDGAAVVEHSDWHLVMATYIEGDVIADDSPAALQQLGRLMGQLHRLSETLPNNIIQRLPLAGWTPTSQFTPHALQQMLDIIDLVPAPLHETHANIVNALRSLSPLTHLPEGILHNDCVPTNAVLTPDKVPKLIDWADAGRGPLLIDLAWLLLQCDGGTPRIPPLMPDVERLYAVIDGYCQYRVPTGPECEAILDALRYVPTVWSGLEFSATLRGETTEHPWQWWWDQYQAAADVVPLIQERFAFHQQHPNM